MCLQIKIRKPAVDNRRERQKVICFFFFQSALRFELLYFRTNDKHANPLDHAAALKNKSFVESFLG
jgi:hypothetical protein